LVDHNPAAPVEADLRRGVSTAYYALFHLLVFSGTDRLVAVAALRPRAARAFGHNVMKTVCHEYARLSRDSTGRFIIAATGEIVPQGVRDIASAFVALQEARHRADYHTEAVFTRSIADTEVMRAELAFLDWAGVQSDPATETFLAELFCRGIPKR
jgi:hypothetical protein